MSENPIVKALEERFNPTEQPEAPAPIEGEQMELEVTDDMVAVDDEQGEVAQNAEFDGFQEQEIPEDAPDQMRAAIQGMNKAQREAAELRKQMESFKEKASTFDQIMNDPSRLKALVDGLAGKSVDENPTQPHSNTLNPHHDIDINEYLEQDTLKAVEYVAADMIEKALLPRLEPYVQAVQQLWNMQQDNQWQSYEDKFPGVTEKRAEIEAIQGKGLSLEQAIYAVMGDSLRQGQKPAAGTSAPKQAPRTPTTLTKPGLATPSRTQPRTPIVSKSVESIAADAKALGIDLTGMR